MVRATDNRDARVVVSAMLVTLGCVCASGLGVRGAVAAPNSPTKGRQTKAHKVAVFPLVVKGEVKAELVDAIQRVLDAGIQGHPGLSVVHGRALRKRLKLEPLVAAARCDRHRKTASCFARLTRRLKVNELLLGRATTYSDGGVRVLLLAIKRNKSIEPRGKLAVTSEDDVEHALRYDRLAEVFGVEPLPSALPQGEEKTAFASGLGERTQESDNEVDSEDFAGPRRPEIEEPKPEAVRSNNASDARDAANASVVPTPALAAPTKGSESVPTAAEVLLASDLSARAASTKRVSTAFGDIPVAQDVALSPPNPLVSAILRYGGIALASSGLGMMGYGGYLGNTSREIRQELLQSQDLVQVEAIRRFRRSNRLAERANLLFVVGGVAAFVGAGMFGYDAFFVRFQE